MHSHCSTLLPLPPLTTPTTRHSPLPSLPPHTGEGEGPKVRDPQILASRSRCGLTLVQGVKRRLRNGKVSRLCGRLLRVCRLTVRSDEPELGDGARRSGAAGKAVGEANVEIGRGAAGVRSIGGGGGLHLSDFRCAPIRPLTCRYPHAHTPLACTRHARTPTRRACRDDEHSRDSSLRWS